MAERGFLRGSKGSDCADDRTEIEVLSLRDASEELRDATEDLRDDTEERSASIAGKRPMHARGSITKLPAMAFSEKRRRTPNTAGWMSPTTRC